MSTSNVTPDMQAPDPAQVAPASNTSPDMGPPALAPQKPSLFKSILMGALQGAAASAGDQTQTFAGGLQHGIGASLQAPIQAQQRAMQQKQVDASTAMHYAELAKIQHEIRLMPSSKQEQYLNDAVDQNQAFVKAGAVVPMGEPGELGDAQKQLLTLHAQHPELVYSIAPVRGEDGSIKYSPVQFTKAPLQQPITLKGVGPNGADITIPAGAPGDLVGKSYTAALSKNIDAANKSSLENQKAGDRSRLQTQKDQAAMERVQAKTAADAAKGSTKPQDLQFGTAPDGSQVAGTKEELAAAGVTNAAKLPGTEAQKVVVARQLMTTRKGLFDLVEKDIDNLAKQGKLGVAASRWGDFMAGKIGGEPDFAPLRTHMGLLATALMQAHVGARGSKEMLQHFKDLANYSISDEATLRAALNAEKQYVQEKAMMPGNKPVQSTTPAQAGGKIRVIDLR